MVEKKSDVNSYNKAIVLCLVMALVIGYALFTWKILFPIFTIAFSIELGALVIIILFLIQRRNDAIQRDEGIKDQSIQRITEINNSFTQLTNELKELNEKIRVGIIKSQKDFELIQAQVAEISKQEQELKKQVKTWEEMKPEAAKLVSAAIEKREKVGWKRLSFEIGLFVAGVLLPYGINYIFFRRSCF